MNCFLVFNTYLHKHCLECLLGKLQEIYRFISCQRPTAASPPRFLPISQPLNSAILFIKFFQPSFLPSAVFKHLISHSQREKQEKSTSTALPLEKVIIG
jgi:hypothetical protein